MSTPRRAPSRSQALRVAAAAPAALTLALCGCIGLTSNQPTQQQYLLRWSDPATASAQPVDGSATANGLAVDRALEVLLPASSPGLAGDGIAVLRPGQRLDYYSGARWAAPVPQMLQGLVVEALRARGRFALVEADGAPFSADWELQVELSHFEAEYQGAGPPTVQVALLCTLGQRVERRAVRMFSARTSVVATADRMSAVVDAFQSATHQALEELAGQLAPVASQAAAPVPVR